MPEFASSDPIESTAFAAAIEEDFRALVQILSSQSINSEMFDEQVLAQIAAARSAAERGLELSRRLVDMTAPRRAEKTR